MINRTFLFLYFRTIKGYFLRHVDLKFIWIKWVLPFEFINILISILTWVYYAQTFGGKSEFLQPYGGDFFSFLLIGIMLSGILNYSIVSISLNYRGLFHSTIGVRGQSLSELDYIFLSGAPVSAAIIGKILDGYLTEGIKMVVYLLIGFLLGFTARTEANYLLAIIVIFIGVLACLGIGLISAGLVTIIGPWRGIDPIFWFFTTLSSLFSGVYFPVEVIPVHFRFLSYMLPQTYTLTVVRSILLGNSGLVDLGEQFLLLIIYALATLIMGMALFNYSLKMLRDNPTPGLEH